MVKDLLRITRLFVSAAGRVASRLAPRGVTGELYQVGVQGAGMVWRT